MICIVVTFLVAFVVVIQSLSNFLFRLGDPKTMKRVTKSSAKEVVKKFLEDMKQKRKQQDESKNAFSAVFQFFPADGAPNVTIEDHGKLYYGIKLL